MSSGKKGITVRFEEGEMRELDALSDRYRVSSATIIRWALRALSNHVERNDGRLVLPLELGDQPAAKPGIAAARKKASSGRKDGPAKKRGV